MISKCRLHNFFKFLSNRDNHESLPSSSNELFDLSPKRKGFVIINRYSMKFLNPICFYILRVRFSNKRKMAGRCKNWQPLEAEANIGLMGVEITKKWFSDASTKLTFFIYFCLWCGGFKKFREVKKKFEDSLKIDEIPFCKFGSYAGGFTKYLILYCVCTCCGCMQEGAKPWWNSKPWCPVEHGQY